MSATYLWPALRISAQYALFAGLWIVFSDKALAVLVPDPAAYAVMQTYKGWFFVAVTGLLLFVLLRAELLLRAQDRDALRALVQEKELLLAELHHRVRNNLQTAIGLVDLVAAQLAGTRDRERMAECVRSLRAMVLIHEELGPGGGPGRVDLARYLERLGRELMGAYDAERRGIALEVRGDGIELDLERAVPLGLIVTELVTNAMKHAFGDGGGSLALELKALDGALRLEVADDGAGLPEDVAPEAASSLGMTIVSGLAAQIGARLTFRREGGTQVVLLLPLGV